MCFAALKLESFPAGGVAATVLGDSHRGVAHSNVVACVLCREEDSLGDISTLADPSVVQQLLDLRGK